MFMSLSGYFSSINSTYCDLIITNQERLVTKAKTSDVRNSDHYRI